MFKELERKKPHLAVRHVRLTCKGAVKYCKRQLVHLSKSSTLRFASSIFLRSGMIYPSVTAMP